ncbi:MAG: endonuclease III [Deltaproteobacteria bacterium]|nr:endonuclease III [Deltaproteobacteria bacterium]
MHAPTEETVLAARRTRETRTERLARAAAILDALRARWPDARCELAFENPWQLLVAVILSAQCTDAKVNQATPALFRRFPSPEALSGVAAEEVEPLIRTLGLFRNKARSLVVTARALVEKHGGQVPGTREELQALAGVGRKTASVVLANAFRVPALAVDTHVGRVARRLGLTTEEDPDGVEQDLCALWPRDAWVDAHHATVLHGRYVCQARRPQCEQCPLMPHCPRVGV